jgi:O-acetyl-ADP-ribose deacetylase (regulator of RNase III)
LESHVRPVTIQPSRRPFAAGLQSGEALAVALLGFFVITLDALVVSVALPAISNDLGGISAACALAPAMGVLVAARLAQVSQGSVAVFEAAAV